MASAGNARVDPAAIVSWPVRPPVENWILGSSAPEIGAKVSVRLTVMGTGNGEEMPVWIGGWEAGPALETPVTVTGGKAGSAMVTGNDALAVAPILSFTATDTWKDPAAVGLPDKLDPLRLMPEGSPPTVQVYGGMPPLAPTPAE